MPSLFLGIHQHLLGQRVIGLGHFAPWIVLEDADTNGTGFSGTD